jgi:hypothetical protein
MIFREIPCPVTPIADGGGVILPGVTADGSPNTRVTGTSNNSFMNLNQSSL